MIEGTVPCSICGEYPILQGGVRTHLARLVCPNYKDKEILHGNLDSNTKGLAMGFTKRNHIFWTEEQAIKSTKDLVLEWNKIHSKT